jgi:hypothetical protein
MSSLLLYRLIVPFIQINREEEILLQSRRIPPGKRKGEGDVQDPDF